MNKKGLTLVEVILALAILGIIAAAFIPIMATSLINLTKTKDLTKDLFLAQQAVEQQMEIARNADTTPSDLTLTIFSKDIIGHSLDVDMPVGLGNSHGEINVFVPKHEVFYNVPAIESASLQVYRSGSLISAPSFIYPLDGDVTFQGSKVDGSQVDFLLNVYRWYMSPISLTPPANFREWIIVKEWNEARTPLSYANSDDFSFIPNIEANFDSLNFARDFGFSDNTIALRYAGRWFVYSVTPYSLIGRIGAEVFSNPISTNRISSVNPIYLTVEYISAGSYDLTGIYGTVPANMMYGMPLAVDITWDDPIIPISSPAQAEIIRYGTVVGYPDPVEFHFLVNDLDPHNDPVASSLAITYGAPSVTVPTSGTRESFYSCSIVDQYGIPMAAEPVTWTLTQPATGISLDPSTVNSSTVRVLISPNAGGVSNTQFTLRAALQADAGIFAEMPVHVSRAYATTSTASTSTSTYQIDYTINVRDSDGNGVDGLTPSDIQVNYVYNNNNTYNSLTTVDGFDNGNVNINAFTPWGNGRYTWSIYSTRFNRTKSSGASVRIGYSSGGTVAFGNVRTRYRN